MPATSTLTVPSRLQGGTGKYPYHEGKHVIAVIERFVYADETGTHDGAPWCIVGGYLGSPREWDRFNRKWRKEIEEQGLEEFHASENLRAISTRSFKRLVSFLAQAPALIPTGSAVNVKDFRSFTPGERRYLTNARITESGKLVTSGAPERQPYQTAFTSLLTTAVMLVENNVRVHFVFDRNHMEQNLALQVFNEIKDNDLGEHWHKLGDITFADSRDYPGLQAADLYVHLWGRKHNYPSGLDPKRQSALDRLIKGQKYPMFEWHRTEMQSALDKYTPAQRQAMREQ